MRLNILAIETSCDDTSVAIVKDGKKVFSNIVASQIEEHALYGGIVPEIASRRHIESISQVYHRALLDAGMTKNDLDAIAVTYAPGLTGALLVGVNFAKGLAFALGLPLIPVHHIRGHIASNYIAHNDLKPPFLALVVSGGHSNIVEVLDYTKFNVLGRTFDDAAGEAFDKSARIMGLSYPGGVYIDKASKKGVVGTYKLPTPKISGSPYDFSFSGLKTAVINLVHNAKQKDIEINTNNLAADINHTISGILVSRTLKAALSKNYSTIAISGGVSANSLLREDFLKVGKENNINIYYPPIEFCGDNAAMIGAQAYHEFLKGNISKDFSLNAIATKSVSEDYE